jgi:Transmembrane domain of unknown function (DUF3566)
VASREERQRSFRTEPETTASGGHLTPDATGPLFDPLFDPLPSDRRLEDEGRPLAASPATLEEEVAPPARLRPTREATRVRRRRVRPSVRRVKRTLKRVNPWTVLKLSLFYYTIFLLVWLVFVAIVYWLLQPTELFEAIQDVGDIFLDWRNVDISLRFVERWALLIGVIGVLAGTLVNTFLALLYNIASDIVGGLEFTFVERDL